MFILKMADSYLYENFEILQARARTLALAALVACGLLWKQKSLQRERPDFGLDPGMKEKSQLSSDSGIRLCIYIQLILLPHRN